MGTHTLFNCECVVCDFGGTYETIAKHLEQSNCIDFKKVAKGGGTRYSSMKQYITVPSDQIKDLEMFLDLCSWDEKTISQHRRKHYADFKMSLGFEAKLHNVHKKKVPSTVTLMCYKVTKVNVQINDD